MTRHRHAVVAALAALVALPAAGRAQQPTQRQLDSLAVQVRALKAELESLRAAVAHAATGAPAARADTSLAALRAAAAAAAGTDTARLKADTLQPTRFIGRERNQAQLNPEISATGDVRAYGQTPGVQRNNFDAREFELGFQSALDPYSNTKIFISLENGAVSVEEGYAYWTGLPGHLRFDIGKFRQQFGELNRWHLHALPETEYPLALRTYLGDDGLAGTGISLYRAFGGLGTHELTAQVTRSASDVELFGGSARPTYLVRLLNFWQLTSSTYLQIGGTGLYGTNPDSALRTKVGGLDFRLTWRPPAQALYRNWTLRGEVYGLRKEVSAAGQTHLGWYVGTTYKLDQRWILGARYDYVEQPVGGRIARQVIPSLTWWESEWVELRAQYTWAKLTGLSAAGQLAIQAVWAIGPHKHETY
ncbi:MAG TPA: hypothetical protein VH158_01630 [Gemmatimonadales bacterium]|jgi:hypothetical protein|nr:hypothetical protein [Gemmatimonadales bacterium]